MDGGTLSSLSGKGVRVANATSFCNRAVDHSDAHLRDIVMNFMIAGRDTTAQVTAIDVLAAMRASHSKLVRARVQTLSWLFYNLSRNQDKEAELLKEIDSFDDDLPDYEELRHMKYITGAINETLRSLPPPLKSHH
jgi:cytochrome P450